MEYGIIYWLDLAGTFVFAVTGALSAGRKKMDVFGVVVLACVTSLGGGTARDLLLGIRPIFWIRDISYLSVGMAGGILTFIVAHSIVIPYRWLLYADAVGLAVFTVVGAQKTLLSGNPAAVAAVMGVVTAVVGGMVRDTLSGEAPMILRQEIYATASIAGVLVFLAAFKLSGSFSLAASLSMPLVFCIRIYSVHMKLSLPVFKSSGQK